MKQVYLVHESGKKYGPFDYSKDLEPDDCQIKLCNRWTYQKQLTPIGFTVEQVLPEKITITKDAVIKSFGLEANKFEFMTAEDVWQKLCEEAGK